MGLSRAQKVKKHGELAAEAPATPRTPREDRVSAAPRRQRRSTELPAAEPTKTKRQPGILIAVVMIIGALLMFYVNILILPEFAHVVAEGHGVPELQVTGYSPEWLAEFSRIIGQDGANLYASVHWSTGLLAPLVMAVGWILFLVIYAKRGLERTGGLVVTGLFPAVTLGGNVAVEQAVAAPANAGLATLSSVLMSTRWVLLVVLMFVTLGVFLRKMRERLQTFDPVAANEQRKKKFGRS
ncbi:hypothetical protein [Kocuria sp. ZOR0020]|uniref:hypothetical protein n=1 Tax=Kocuria sp. ZOR0020 TaxID=1339234 RepID=UPI00064827C4|nr:hypothetical protein [Kocuria sp. ZOR0020]